MFDEIIVKKVVELIENLNYNFTAKNRFHPDGDFGDLNDIDFSNGRLLGHVALWSSGLVFYNLFDDSKDVDYEIIEEAHIDTTSMSMNELILILQPEFEKALANY